MVLLCSGEMVIHNLVVAPTHKALTVLKKHNWLKESAAHANPLQGF
jgi:hypothetical protein